MSEDLSGKPVELFGKSVKESREKEGLSQEELAAEVGISRVYLSQIERGIPSNVSWGIVTRLAERLGISVGNDSADVAEIPTELAEWGKRNGIKPVELTMLARIQFRGKRPRTPEQWGMLYNIIKGSSSMWKDDE